MNFVKINSHYRNERKVLNFKLNSNWSVLSRCEKCLKNTFFVVVVATIKMCDVYILIN